MASIKVKFRASSVEDNRGSIYYQIIHEHMVRQLSTNYRVYTEEWDDLRSMVRFAQCDDRKPLIRSMREDIRLDVERLKKIVRRLDNDGLTYTAEDVVDEFRRYVSEYSLFNYMGNLIDKFRQKGKMRTSETYAAALRSFRKFLEEDECRKHLLPDHDIMLDCINTELMETYEAWHKSHGNTPNTISFYTRILRAVYNRAVDDGAIENHNPFRHVYTGVEKTVKRAIPLSQVKKIKALDLSHFPNLDYARDMFMLSFFLRGMSFIDMAFLRKADLKSGYVVYRRRKTGQQLTIAWISEMQHILDKYPANPTQYLLPIIKRTGINERSAFRNIGSTINRSLKQIARMAGIKIPLTLYVARHSWASAAKAKGIPLSVISEGMGHDSEATTLIYLASLDTSVVDKANAFILSAL